MRMRSGPEGARCGPLPTAVQKGTVYSAGIAKKAATPAGARSLVTVLASPAMTARFAAAGLDYKE